MWRELVRSVAPRGARFNPGASEAALREAEEQLGWQFPEDLRALLAESDGIEDEPRWTVLAWPVERIVRENMRHQDRDWPFAKDGPWSDRLCFADDGCGNDFFFDLSMPDRCVCVWNYIDSQAYEVASTFRAFWTGWLSGTLDARW